MPGAIPNSAENGPRYRARREIAVRVLALLTQCGLARGKQTGAGRQKLPPAETAGSTIHGVIVPFSKRSLLRRDNQMLIYLRCR